jgi:hypothetical protein
VFDDADDVDLLGENIRESTAKKNEEIQGRKLV